MQTKQYGKPCLETCILIYKLVLHTKQISNTSLLIKSLLTKALSNKTSNHIAYKLLKPSSRQYQLKPLEGYILLNKDLAHQLLMEPSRGVRRYCIQKRTETIIRIKNHTQSERNKSMKMMNFNTNQNNHQPKTQKQDLQSLTRTNISINYKQQMEK